MRSPTTTTRGRAGEPTLERSVAMTRGYRPVTGGAGRGVYDHPDNTAHHPSEMTTTPDRQQLAIDTIRTLSIDMVQQANSGHPGTPMAMAPVAYTLWQRFLRFDPADPIWPNRDRFVLSIGHASTLRSEEHTSELQSH